MSLNNMQIVAMLELQESMNKKVNPDWLNAGYPFLRAVVIEGAEGIEHHGYKWWKANQKDLAQLKMELIDIWHFMLSHLLVSEYLDGKAFDGDDNDYLFGAVGHILDTLRLTGSSVIYFDGNTYELSKLDTLTKLELLIGLSVSRRLNFHLFESLMNDVGMDWPELYRQYISKNVLNMFRQSNGYKQGAYIKIWSGREDNEHLVELMNSLDANHPDFQGILYGLLETNYAKYAQPVLANS